ncbi:MAG: hypothetical protein WC656_01905 [Sulfurimonas sp.]|jgi:hypothetical protein
MIKIDRNELIEKSIKFRVLKRNSTLFVNMFAVHKAYSFSCEIDEIDEELEKMAFTEHSILTNFILRGKELKTDAYFIEISSKHDQFYGVLSNGEVIECRNNEFDFDYIIPTKDEFKTLIFKNVEEF